MRTEITRTTGQSADGPMTNRIRMRLIERFLNRNIHVGSLQIRGDGVDMEVSGTDTDLVADVLLRDSRAVARNTLRRGGIGFAEAYIDGEWESSDLATLLELAARNHDLTRAGRGRSSVIRAARSVWKRTAAVRGEAAVETMVDHYDLGNDFYATWLDSSMSYSSGIYAEGDDLEAAMRRKYELLARRCGIQRGDHVLEIGSGWGAMAEYLAAELDCTVVTCTISREQRDFVEARINAAELGHAIDVRLADFSEITGEYDRIVSVEMIESIDDSRWPELFEVMERSLKPGGTAGLQVITIEEELEEALTGRDDFITAYIFPGGALPSKETLRTLGDDAGLEFEGIDSHGESYARTLAEWDGRFVAAWDEITDVDPRFDEKFRRMWRYYLAYCEAGFRTGRIDGVQVAYRKPVGF